MLKLLPPSYDLITTLPPKVNSSFLWHSVTRLQGFCFCWFLLTLVLFKILQASPFPDKKHWKAPGFGPRSSFLPYSHFVSDLTQAQLFKNHNHLEDFPILITSQQIPFEPETSMSNSLTFLFRWLITISDLMYLKPKLIF